MNGEPTLPKLKRAREILLGKGSSNLLVVTLVISPDFSWVLNTQTATPDSLSKQLGHDEVDEDADEADYESATAKLNAKVDLQEARPDYFR